MQGPTQRPCRISDVPRHVHQVDDIREKIDVVVSTQPRRRHWPALGFRIAQSRCREPIDDLHASPPINAEATTTGHTRRGQMGNWSDHNTTPIHGTRFHDTTKGDSPPRSLAPRFWKRGRSSRKPQGAQMPWRTRHATRLPGEPADRDVKRGASSRHPSLPLPEIEGRRRAKPAASTLLPRNRGTRTHDLDRVWFPQLDYRRTFRHPSVILHT